MIPDMPPVKREGDRPASIGEKKARIRILRTVGGLIIGAAGCWFALVNPTMAVFNFPVGFIVALVGVGAIEPTIISGFFRNNDREGD